MRGKAITATLVATLAVGLAAGCGGDSAREQGDKQLKAVAVPGAWRETSRTFTDGGSHVPYDEWLVAYRAQGSALEALRAYDASARAAGWQRDLDCGLELDISGGAGCWFRTGYRLRYEAQVDSPCTADCVSVTIRLVNE